MPGPYLCLSTGLLSGARFGFAYAISPYDIFSEIDTQEVTKTASTPAAADANAAQSPSARRPPGCRPLSGRVPSRRIPGGNRHQVWSGVAYGSDGYPARVGQQRDCRSD